NPIFLENCNSAAPMDLKYNITALLSQLPIAHICVNNKPASIAAVALPILML
ncbi:11131_t:CDS:1, partial [Dentiscutata erythropus]